MSKAGTGTSLPTLADDRGWWVVESLKINNRSQEQFRVFEATSGRTEEEAVLHANTSDELLDAQLMGSAIRRGEIVDHFEWQPVSDLIKRLSIKRVTTEEEISSLDPMLLDMLREHEFFLSDIEENSATVIGGGTYQVL
ncbi:hypothetical protein GAO09_16225 [Rhizobiales bacterium RZME27]|jgi:hypothetical protein|uniref:Uncharacterized protein n=1 Tax=Endobacterium cereale TaxID=2663029 RepID=A0A6A8A8K0_9HYPH|nr:hypothetical protein [Endobacterium cereale]MEB2846999.1 hypothetical protein [Endobacterium cereale]MQY47582.1 hypothetical protein [Endobacterium cereale]